MGILRVKILVKVVEEEHKKQEYFVLHDVLQMYNEKCSSTSCAMYHQIKHTKQIL